MATIYKVESKAYLQELIQYLYGDGYDWFDGVSLLNQERIDSAWIVHHAELGIYISNDGAVYNGKFDDMVQNSSDDDKIVKVVKEVRNNVIKEDFHSTVKELESLAREVPDLIYSNTNQGAWYSHLMEIHYYANHIKELIENNDMRLTDLLAKDSQDNS